uniref:Ring finger and CCCH-type domains 1 n=1 Tax=Otolemur garnettii TaxID=30611 RepID=H0WP17_OTOGA
MPVQAPQWTDFLSCPICTQTFDETIRKPISLGCGHTVCKMCLNKLHRKACPFDQTTINTDIELLPVNSALLQLVGAQVPEQQPITLCSGVEDTKHYEEAKKCVEELALYLKPLSSARGVGLNSTTQSVLSRPMQRKLVTLVHCQLVEEEGRIRAMRAARSLGERTVTELILQHQNPQQLSSNLWAAVRARGCQFLGPAMQEEALKLVLLALEDGSALSRKVLVLFVVQRLEPRFPQASKTSIGHVVQLLYRASCFKLTSYSQEKEVLERKKKNLTFPYLIHQCDLEILTTIFRSSLRELITKIEALILGSQSSLGKLMFIFFKLQTPASFAQSVQELTIALQRTGDPANLNRLRPHLELLANIDPSPDLVPPSLSQLINQLILKLFKLSVYQYFVYIKLQSKLTDDRQFPPQHSKYKTYMCRDMKQRGGCPRGASCTFAHSQEELEKFRKMNKRLVPRRPLSASLGQLNEVGLPSTAILPDEGTVDLPSRKPPALPNGIVSAGNTVTQLIPRGTDPSYDSTLKPGKIDHLSSSAPGSPPDLLESVPKSISALPVNPHPVPPRGPTELPAMPVTKPLQMVPRGSQLYPAQPADVYYQDPRGAAPPFEPAPYQQGMYYTPPPQCVSRFVRPPPSAPEPGPPYLDHYPPYLQDRVVNSQYGTQPQQYPPMYPPHYDGRRVYPAQSYTREEIFRESPIPIEIPPAAVPSYVPESRERFQQIEGYYPVAPHPPQIRPSYLREPTYSRLPPPPQPHPSLDELHRRRKEIMAQLEERKVISPPPFAPSPTLPPTFHQEEFLDEDLKVAGKYKGNDYSQYSPWSCDTIGSYIGTKDAKPKDVVAAGSVEMMNVESKGMRDQRLDLQRRATETSDDDLIPFGDRPTVSRFGAISRTSKTIYQGAGPMQAMAPQGAPTKSINISDYSPYGTHGGWGGSPYSPHHSIPSQGHFSERERISMSEVASHGKPLPSAEREQLRLELQQLNHQISQQTQLRGLEAVSNRLVLQREANTLAGQPQPPPPPPKWPGMISSEQLSLELHQVEREIGKRTRELSMESQCSLDMKSKLNTSKQAENGQPEPQNKVPAEDLTLTFSDVPNGSALTQENISLLSNKTSSLNLSEDPEGRGDNNDSQKSGVTPSSAP